MTARLLPLVLGTVLLLAGCGDGAAEVADDTAAGGDRAVTTTVAPPRATPTELPPGDPGLDAPSVPDPGEPKRRHKPEPALKVVPPESMLGAGTVSGVLGGRWHGSAGNPTACADATGGVADRTVVYRADGGQLLQTIVTHRSPAAADRAVARLGRKLSQCGWAPGPDPRLGSASATASNADGDRSAVVVAAEGVTVTLVGSGSAIGSRPRWSALADIALGNVCAAAPDGCH